MDPLCCHHLNIFSLSGSRLNLEPAPATVLALESRTTEAAGKTSKLSSLNELLRLRYIFFYGMYRAISTARLNRSPCLHLRPIDVVVCDGPVNEI